MNLWPDLQNIQIGIIFYSLCFQLNDHAKFRISDQVCVNPHKKQWIQIYLQNFFHHHMVPWSLSHKHSKYTKLFDFTRNSKKVLQHKANYLAQTTTITRDDLSFSLINMEVFRKIYLWNTLFTNWNDHEMPTVNDNWEENSLFTFYKVSLFLTVSSVKINTWACCLRLDSW